MKPVPPELVADAIKKYLFIVSETINKKEKYSELEFQLLSWGSQFQAVVQPFTGTLLLPDPPQGNKGAKA